jgi:asparagine synthase (glutamine-hydrolysing)
MCGIFCLINLRSDPSTSPLVKGTEIISHRGPDDEGYMLFDNQGEFHNYLGTNTSKKSIESHKLKMIPDKFPWKVGFGHKRLSIIDLSPAGHQPMIDPESGLALIFNGEIYNYKELRIELEQKGHRFKTATDTEVLLRSWDEWGVDAPPHFNGMFAFIIHDAKKRRLYVVRDRFGVKPLYYTNKPGYIAFASEVKQLRTLPEYQLFLNEQNAYDYLRYGFVDHNSGTFEQEVNQVDLGNYIEVNLENNTYHHIKWYDLLPQKWTGSFEEASEQFYFLLKDSVRLRMRSDVPVGSALSGGLDSSIIVSLMREVLNDQNQGEYPIKTITSCFDEEKYDEWKYANRVIKRINGKPYRIFPTFEKLIEDIDKFLWHMDYPLGSTSQFSQWCVFKGAFKAGLKVMIDGQGADEQLAGYEGNDMSLYTGLLNQFKVKELAKETIAYCRYHKRFPTGYLIGAAQNNIPEVLLNLLPEKFRVIKQYPPDWLRTKRNSTQMKWPGSLQKSLFRQITKAPLPSLLRYEDRNSMAFSIESRVPFMDYRLIEFTQSLPESYIYRRGERKHILRKTFYDLVPKEIIERKDKMGFVSAEENWLKYEGKNWFMEQVSEAGNNMSDLINKDKALNMLTGMAENNKKFSFSPWRILNLNRFINQVNK